LFQEFVYQTRESWSRARRVVAKVEHLEKGENPRFVVTSLSAEAWPAQALYEEHYCARGDMENRIKEQLMLFSDRTSTHYLRSNQLRLYFSSIAYVLLQMLRRLGLAGTELAPAQWSTVRLKLLKIGALIRITVRKVWISLAGGYPRVTLFRQVHEKLCAVPLKVLKKKGPEQLFPRFCQQGGKVCDKTASERGTLSRQAKKGSATQQHPANYFETPNSNKLHPASAKL
jgi:hypothetical protein